MGFRLGSGSLHSFFGFQRKLICLDTFNAGSKSFASNISRAAFFTGYLAEIRQEKELVNAAFDTKKLCPPKQALYEIKRGDS